jgi:hypothetical protein
MGEIIFFALLIILFILIFVIGKKFLTTEHQMPGHGVAGQWGLRDFTTTEKFYTSGASLRDQSLPDTRTEETIPTQAFNAAELKYYMKR